MERKTALHEVTMIIPTAYESGTYEECCQLADRLRKALIAALKDKIKLQSLHVNELIPLEPDDTLEKTNAFSATDWPGQWGPWWEK